MPTKIDVAFLARLLADAHPPVDLNLLAANEWDELMRAAKAEGVGPLIYWNLSRSGVIASIPAVQRNRLREMYFDTWAQNQKVFADLKTLAEKFSRAGIPAVILKGACYSLTIYPDAGLRPMADLDLLIPKDRFGEAIRLAQNLGYEEEVEALSGLRDLLNHEVCLRKKDRSSVPLELHHRLLGNEAFRFSVPVDWFWSQTEPMSHALQTLYPGLQMLTPTAQLLFASAHAMLQHGGKKTPLRWYYDIDQLIRFYGVQIDWDVLLSRSKTFEWSSALEVALSKSSDLFGTPLPASAVRTLSARTDANRILVEANLQKAETHTLEELRKMQALNIAGKMGLLLSLLFPQPTYMYRRYQFRSPGLLPAYYLIRWWGILVDLLITMLSITTRGLHIRSDT